MSNSRHILIITPGFPKDKNDFNCIPPLQEFILKLRLTYPSSKVSVISLHYPYQSKSYDWKSTNVIALAGKNRKWIKPLLWLKAMRKGKKIHASSRVDVIRSLWFGECAMIGNILSKKFGCKHICTLMGQDVKNSNRYLRLLQGKQMKIVALSKNQNDQFFLLTGRNADEIIHWGIDDQPAGSAERDIDLLGAGSLIPLKNYSLFIKTVEAAVTKFPKLKCVLAGSGPESSKLKILAVEKGLQGNIEFTGLIGRTEIFKLMQRSKIFSHPSVFEGSGFVFAEALVNVMNIVSFNVGYARAHPKWFIANNEQDFIDQTKNLLASELDYGPIDHFNINKTINDYAALYGVEGKACS